MAKRYFICPVVGTGGPPESGNSYRASVADVQGVAAKWLIPAKPDGSPKFRFAFCVFAASGPKFVEVSQITNSLVFPDYPLDARLDGMESGARTAMVQSAQAYDLDGEGLHLDLSAFGDSNSYRELIIGLAQQIEPAFNLSIFDVSETVD